MPWGVLIVLTPAVASVVALLLEWSLLLFVLVFAEVLAGLVWLATALGGALVWLKVGLAVADSAYRVDGVMGATKGAVPPRDPPAPQP